MKKQILLALVFAGTTPLAYAAELPSLDRCEPYKDVPLVKEIIAKHSSLDADNTVLGHSLDNLRKQCAAYRNNPSQTGEAIAPMKSALSDVQGRAPKFSQAVDLELPVIKEGRSGLQGIGDRECSGALGKYYAGLIQAKNKAAADARAACDVGSAKTRAEETSKQISSGDTSETERQKTRDALLNPKAAANRERSAALLRQAELYHQQEVAAGRLPANTPSPRANANDQVCGNSCVALLRAQSLSDNPDSPAYKAALETAASTKRGRYGSLVPR